MATKGAYKRLTKEYIAIQKRHYVITGPPETPYEAGQYHGKLVFPADYPFKPPSIRMTTPSGRFQTDTRLCLTMSDFHPSFWNPSWSVATILNGLLSFMVGEESTTGSIKTTETEKRILATRSHKFNLANPKFRDIFPELCTAEPSPLPKLNHTSVPAAPQSQTPTTLTRRSIGVTAAAAAAVAEAKFDAATAMAEVKSEASVPTAVGTVAVQRNNMFAWTFGQWRRWLLVFVVCVYLLGAKLIARSGGNVSGGSS
ncbi:UBC-like protein [Endogone sp. FLAS-F59071]|nr:UBC-like protein [Endogone sp. FLAS-F59071]|eukprot:RUS13773.1 UBC-like protein [Endogone sp. FLAS-F59071]